MLRDTLIYIMMGLPAHHLDHEDSDARLARLSIIGEAVADVSAAATCSSADTASQCQRIWPGTSLELGVLLVTQAYSESRLAKNVHEGNCRPYECDPVRIAGTGEIHHRARSLWQIHHILPIEEEWERMSGANFASTRAAAWAAAKLLSRGYRACGTFVGAISRYAGVNGCHWSEAKQRSKLFEQLRARAWRRENETTRAERQARVM
ncbi:MAG: hypothetical protein QM784_37620 [Polyangiaceae bacterium]